jgi:hypothetical protein
VFENHAAVEQYLLQAEVVVPNPWNNFACDQKQEKHTSFSFDLPFKPTCSKMFYFAGRRKGIIHPVKFKCKPEDCVAFETNLEKKNCRGNRQHLLFHFSGMKS